MAAEITLRSFDPVSDWQPLSDWLRRSHVMQWWGDAEQEVQDLRQRSPDNHAIILVDGVPAGYMLWHRPSRAELEDAGLADLPAGLVDIDIMCGKMLTSSKLAASGFHVILASRNQQTSAQAIARMTADNPSASVESIPLDLASLTAVRQCAKRRSSDDSYDQAKAQRLWELSWHWCGLGESGPS